MARERSKVTVEFVDGEVREYVITASVNIAGYLAQEMQGGALRMSDYDSGSAVVIPSAQIKQIKLQTLSDEPERKALPSDRPIDYNDHIDDPYLGLSNRAVNALVWADIKTVRDLMTPTPMTDEAILRLRRVGRQTGKEIIAFRNALVQAGL